MEFRAVILAACLLIAADFQGFGSLADQGCVSSNSPIAVPLSNPYTSYPWTNVPTCLRYYNIKAPCVPYSLAWTGSPLSCSWCSGSSCNGPWVTNWSVNYPWNNVPSPSQVTFPASNIAKSLAEAINDTISLIPQAVVNDPYGNSQSQAVVPPYTAPCQLTNTDPTISTPCESASSFSAKQTISAPCNPSQTCSTSCNPIQACSVSCNPSQTYCTPSQTCCTPYSSGTTCTFSQPCCPPCSPSNPFYYFMPNTQYSYPTCQISSPSNLFNTPVNNLPVPTSSQAALNPTATISAGGTLNAPYCFNTVTPYLSQTALSPTATFSAGATLNAQNPLNTYSPICNPVSFINATISPCLGGNSNNVYYPLARWNQPFVPQNINCN